MRIFVSIFCIFFLSLSNAQSVELSTGFNRLDYQVGFAYGHDWRHFHFTPKFELGVGTTFGQKRFSPRYSVGSSYFLLRKGLVDFGPEIVYAYSRLRITDNGKTAHHWNEVNLGYRLHIGRTIKLVHSANAGWMNEIFYSESIGRVVNYNSFGFYAQIGVSYTF